MAEQSRSFDFHSLWQQARQRGGLTQGLSISATPEPCSPNCPVGRDFLARIEKLIIAPLGNTMQERMLEAAKYQLTELFHRTRRVHGNQDSHLACLLTPYLAAYDRLDELLLLQHPPSLDPPHEPQSSKNSRKSPKGRILFGEAE